MKYMYTENWNRRQEGRLMHPRKTQQTWKTRNDKLTERYIGTAEMRYSIKHSHLNLYTGDVDHVSLDEGYDLCA